MDRKVVEVVGRLYVEAPKNRNRRQTIYPRVTPSGYPLGDRSRGHSSSQASVRTTCGSGIEEEGTASTPNELVHRSVRVCFTHHEPHSVYKARTLESR